MTAPVITAIIPARGGSKGIPRKNLRLLGGKPLLQWSIEAARTSKHITHTYVSTDDAEIAEAADILDPVRLERNRRIASLRNFLTETLSVLPTDRKRSPVRTWQKRVDGWTPVA